MVVAIIGLTSGGGGGVWWWCGGGSGRRDSRRACGSVDGSRHDPRGREVKRVLVVCGSGGSR